MHSYPNLKEFIDNLSTSNHLDLTPTDIKNIKLYINSDGCTGVPDFYVDECIKHDFYYRTHTDFTGKLISKEDADTRFRLGIQNKSKLNKLNFWKFRFGVLSPVSWIRYLGVRFHPAAKSAWEGSTSCS